MMRRIAETFAARGVVVVGIGADGWAGLGEPARHALRECGTVIASPRQLAHLPVWLGARRVEWRSLRRADITALIDEHADTAVVVLASGDPLVHGIGRTLVDELGANRLLFLPTLSSVTLACARLGWPVEDTTVLNAAGGGLRRLPSLLPDATHLIVLSAGRDTPAALAARLTALGYGASALSVLGDLGAPNERRWDGVAASWNAKITAALNLVAVTVHGPPRAAVSPGAVTHPPPMAPVVVTPPAAYSGAVTPRRDSMAGGAAAAMSETVLVSQLTAVGPAPGHILWEIGGDARCAGIWAAHPEAGPSITVRWSDCALDRSGRSPVGLTQALGRVGSPDAVLLADPARADPTVWARTVDKCWELLRPGGRLVGVGHNLEDSAVLLSRYRTMGGTMTRFDCAAATLDSAGTHWQPGESVTLWRLAKPTG
ncbi:Precorrin-6Y C(5,15)-methyltransferase [decarboxylating] [Austwickia sp. TVS 96-490-7B]|uniref:precorrin-6y C5,15-methyltransferase (decarboxylating) subunit CbiE n=1 Tax=Austwickia sp. TVS 96-490-7B TaxID=2830843 RepID=UPI001C5A0459|nr:precorrin-6y C5,15-methyltransferase (decarboxylating) subunit CbiE [Austwickia sp. TVS 96-490-7B]MBW3086076.1 Precorrin-6Y C(5,15)-methyltransferase [decarboxylating] [Austwickia sp. TVS 96-490-7B]